MTKTTDRPVHRYRLIECRADAPALAALLAACGDFFSRHALGEGQAPSLAALTSDLAPEQIANTRLVAFEKPDGSAVAMALLVKNWQRPRQWCLRTTVVDPAWRSQGIGGALYA
jgi:hypothetical protein